MASIAAVLNRSGQRPASDLVLRFLEHFAAIRDALASQGLWDETDGLYYDRLVTPSGEAVPVKARSMVGIIPALTAVVIDEKDLQHALTMGKQFANLMGREGLSDTAKLRELGVLRGEPGDQHLLLSLAGPAGAAARLAVQRGRVPVPGTGGARCPPGTAIIPTNSTSKTSGPASTTSRPNRPRPCSAGTPTGAARSGSR